MFFLFFIFFLTSSTLICSEQVAAISLLCKAADTLSRTEVAIKIIRQAHNLSQDQLDITTFQNGVVIYKKEEESIIWTSFTGFTPKFLLSPQHSYCSYCSKHFLTKPLYERHQNICKNLFCKYCGQHRKSPVYLKRHELTCRKNKHLTNNIKTYKKHAHPI